MVGTAAALLFLLCAQDDESRLREAWPKLVEAWQALETYDGAKEGEWQDGLLPVMGKVHAAFEAAGFLDPDAGFEVAALKRFFGGRYTIHLEKVSSPSGKDSLEEDLGVLVLRAEGFRNRRAPATYGFDSLFASLQKVRELREKGLDDEENVGDEMSVVRKSLKALGLMSDSTHGWLRRRFTHLVRALVLKEPFPEPAKASDEQARTIRGHLADLSSPDADAREKATAALLKDGEIARPFLREALKSPDPEVVSRAKTILGVGHAPWKDKAEAKPNESLTDDEDK